MSGEQLRDEILDRLDLHLTAIELGRAVHGGTRVRQDELVTITDLVETLNALDEGRPR
jgi:hypothetical protein